MMPLRAGAESDADREAFFETQIRPLLAKHCFECHGPKKQQGGLRLDSREFVLKGNENGPAIVTGKPAESRMLEVLNYEEGDIQMPPAGKLSPEELASLEKWITDGAFWPKASEITTATSQADANGLENALGLSAALSS